MRLSACEVWGRYWLVTEDRTFGGLLAQMHLLDLSKEFESEWIAKHPVYLWKALNKNKFTQNEVHLALEDRALRKWSVTINFLFGKHVRIKLFLLFKLCLPKGCCSKKFGLFANYCSPVIGRAQHHSEEDPRVAIYLEVLCWSHNIHVLPLMSAYFPSLLLQTSRLFLHTLLSDWCINHLICFLCDHFVVSATECIFLIMAIAVMTTFWLEMPFRQESKLYLPLCINF